MDNQVNLLVESARQFLAELAATLPQIIGAVIILVVGWLIARVVKALVVKGLNLVKLPALLEKAGVEDILKSGGMRVSAVVIIGTLVYWTIMLIVILAALNSINLTAATDLFNQIILYIPNIIVSVFILIIGMYLARLVSSFFSASLKTLKEETANLIGKMSYFAVIIFTVFIILSQLNIASEIVESAFTLLFGAICLALGLAFGLGGRDRAAKILDEIFTRERKEESYSK